MFVDLVSVYLPSYATLRVHTSNNQIMSTTEHKNGIAKDVDMTEVTDRKVVVVGSRQSCLAMIQTNHVIDLLKVQYPDHEFEVRTMETIGDKNLDKALPEIGDKGLFTQELESALLNKQVDFIVHSLKDLPTSLPPNCSIGAILEREDPADVLVLREGLVLEDPFSILTDSCVLPVDPPQLDAHLANNGSTKDSNELAGTSTAQQEIKTRAPVIGSSSLRRQSQVRRFHAEANVISVRGNINTRLNKLDGKWVPPAGRSAQHFDALILAASGLKRGGFENRISYSLGRADAENGSKDWYHAVGQGALAIECRQHDEFIHKFLAPLTHRKTIYETLAERSLLFHLEGGCSVPIGVRTQWSGPTNDAITLSAAIFSVDGKREVSGKRRGLLVTQLPDDHSELMTKRRKFGSDENLVIGLPILPTSCPILRSNYEVCFTVGKVLAHELMSKGGGEILKDIKCEKERRTMEILMRKQKIGERGDTASSSDDGNSSFEHM